MPQLSYPYKQLPGAKIFRPFVSVVATNLKNGISQQFDALVDTGASTTHLSLGLLASLQIEQDELIEDETTGVGEVKVKCFICDFIKISFLEIIYSPKPTAIEHFPYGRRPVPLTFVKQSLNLLGQRSFLDLCGVCCYGPEMMTYVEF